MIYDKHLTTKSWEDYELLDSGDNMKLERFGEIVVARPETEALWKKNDLSLWKQAQATFAFEKSRGSWKTHTELPDTWELSFGDVRFTAKRTAFKHTGIFPEQAPNWTWLRERVQTLAQHEAPHVLNLFGYTGIASLIAAKAGAFVTHVDGSKQSVAWAADNAKLSRLPGTAIRWMVDDALSFVRREVRRGASYQGIILDPPAFGRGAKGETWKIEEDLIPLLTGLSELLSKTPGSFFVLNGYAAGYASRSFAQAIESVFGDIQGESGELHIQENTGRVLPAGIYVRFTK